MWKVFVESGGAPTFLFHGVGGTKNVPLDRWMQAEVKWAKEGSNPYYWTAFHCYPSLDVISRWCRSVRRFDRRYVVEIEVRKTRKKPTNGHAILADGMLLSSEGWANRIPLKNFRKAPA